MRRVAVLVVFACGCDGGTEFPNQPGGNPLVPEVAALPFPSDFYLVPDGETETGRRVALPAEVLPERATPDVLAGVDGFSQMPVIVAYLPGGVDAGSLPALDDPAATVADDSPVLLVEEGTWERIPILPETDLTAFFDDERSLLIRPLRLLAENRGYVVILRDRLRAPDGAPHTAGAAFRALRDDMPTNEPAIEAQRDDFVLVNRAIAEQGLDPEEVVLAWSFHTRSQDSVVGTLLALHDLVETATIGPWEIVSDEIEQDGVDIDRQIRAVFQAPNFIDPQTGLIATDAAGAPRQLGTREVEFSITVPGTLDEPRPVVIYGHGVFGSYTQGTRGMVNAISHDHEFTTVATFIGFNEQNLSLTFKALSDDLTGFHALVADIQQNIANQTALARLVREQVAGDLTAETVDGPIAIIDPDQVRYMGISNGGTFGFLTAATSTQLDRAALLVGGGGLIHFLERAVQWNEFGALLNQIYPEPRVRQLVLSILQTVMDPIDPINYAAHLVHDRFPGRRPLRALALMAVNDSQVRNLVTEWVARTADLALVTPSPRDVFGLRTTTAPLPDGTSEPGALFVYDEMVEPSPLGNVPPAEDNDTHGTFRDLAAVQQQVATFLIDGSLVQFCEGACDPE